MSFGPAYTYMLLRLLYGLRWSETEAPRALAMYCVYILLLAANGILEAFVHAVAESRCVQCLVCCPAANYLRQHGHDCITWCEQLKGYSLRALKADPLKAL